MKFKKTWFEGDLTVEDCRSVPATIMSRLCDHVNPRVLEIGTAYGQHLKFFSDRCDIVVSIDCMYDWVPNIKPNEEFDIFKISDDKVNQWDNNAGDNCWLLIGSSHEIYKDMEKYGYDDMFERLYDVLIIDGDHSTKDAVLDDTNYVKFLDRPCMVIFDDIDIKTCGEAAKEFENELKRNNTLHDRINVTNSYVKTEAAIFLIGGDE